jgi:hypothetical protein
MKELQKYVLEHTTSFNAEVLPWSDELVNKLSALQTTSEKFHGQLKRLFALTQKAEDNIGL